MKKQEKCSECKEKAIDKCASCQIPLCSEHIWELEDEGGIWRCQECMGLVVINDSTRRGLKA